MLHLEFSTKPCLEESDDVGGYHLSSCVPEKLSSGFFQAGTKVMIPILVHPLVVGCDALELGQKRLEAGGLVKGLQLYQVFCQL